MAMEGIQAGIRGGSINGNERMRLSGDATMFLEKHKLALTMHRIMLTFHSPGKFQSASLLRTPMQGHPPCPDKLAC
jgi:hypothetical protein